VASMRRDESGRVAGFGDFPLLQTRRLNLRRMTTEDAAFYLELFSDPDVVELTSQEAPRGIEGATKELLEYCVQLFEENKGIRWGIERKGLIGTIGYHHWVKEAFRASVGYDLVASSRRQGFMTEALSEVLRFGFMEMRLNKVEAHVNLRNKASIRLLHKLGFRQEGVLRDETFFHGRFVDKICFGLLVREWEKPAHLPESSSSSK
jgi:ribosomal-protein-alanine N-acetyltransferase